jgi:hypothetical protein
VRSGADLPAQRVTPRPWRVVDASAHMWPPAAAILRCRLAASRHDRPDQREGPRSKTRRHPSGANRALAGMACSSAAVGMRSRRRPSAASGRSQPDREQSTSTSRPPGRSTRVISGSPAGWSAQCAKETVLTTRSKLALGEQQPLGGRLRQAHPRVGAEGGPHLDHGRAGPTLASATPRRPDGHSRWSRRCSARPSAAAWIWRPACRCRLGWARSPVRSPTRPKGASTATAARRLPGRRGLTRDAAQPARTADMSRARADTGGPRGRPGRRCPDERRRIVADRPLPVLWIRASTHALRALQRMGCRCNSQIQAAALEASSKRPGRLLDVDDVAAHCRCHGHAPSSPARITPGDPGPARPAPIPIAAGWHRGIAAARQPQRGLVVTTAGRLGAILAPCRANMSGPRRRHASVPSLLGNPLRGRGPGPLPLQLVGTAAR